MTSRSFKGARVTPPTIYYVKQCGLVSGVQLDWKRFGTRAKIMRVPCNACAKAKISRTSFSRSQERMADHIPGQRENADTLIMLNTSSREGFKYVLILVDFVSKYVWLYPLVSRDEASVLKCLAAFIQSAFPPFGFKLGQLHSDSGAELVSAKVLTSYLPTESPPYTHLRDTPEINSIVERKVKDLKQRALCMPVPFCWLSVRASRFIFYGVPTPPMARLGSDIFRLGLELGLLINYLTLTLTLIEKSKHLGVSTNKHVS